MLLATAVIAGALVSGVPHPQPSPLRGIASFYWQVPAHGAATASGEPLIHDDLTAAHKTLPFGTLVRVTRNDTGRSITVRINDRGPFVHGHVIDLTLAGARAMNMVERGLVPVSLSIVKGRDGSNLHNSKGR